MIRKLVDRYFNDEDKYAEMFGLSSDNKPVGGLVTGSKFIEVDTGIEYRFDEESVTWIPQNSGNGKTSIQGATVTLGSALKYDGTEKTKAVSSVVLGETTLAANTDYIVKDNKATDIGSYVLHIVGIGSYTGAIAVDFQIAKGDGSVTASPDSLSLTEGGDAGESALTITGDGAVSVESSAVAVATAELVGSKVIVTPVGEGSATITVTLADGDNYNGGTDTISVTVAAEAEGEEPMNEHPKGCFFHTNPAGEP